MEQADSESTGISFLKIQQTIDRQYQKIKEKIEGIIAETGN